MTREQRESYKKGKLEANRQAITFCEKKLEEIKSHPTVNRKEISEKRKGVFSAYTDMLIHLNAERVKIFKYNIDK